MTLLMTGKLSQTHKREGKDFFRVSVVILTDFSLQKANVQSQAKAEGYASEIMHH